MLFLEKPEDFDSKMEVSSVFLEHDGRFLFLLRNDNKHEGNKWGVPAGKMDNGEDKRSTLIREMKEEIKVELAEDNINECLTVYVRYPEVDYIFHISHYRLDQKPEIVLDESENKEYRWVTLEDALQLNLVKDEDGCIGLFKNGWYNGNTANS